MKAGISKFDAATAYIAISNYNTTDDYKPYLYKTSDYGKTWTNLSASFPQNETLRTVREDIKVKGMLYAGTERGVFVSLDDGKTWRDLSENLPAVPVVDLEVKNNDLVIATNGRGFWVLDDMSPIRNHAKRYQQDVLLFDVSDHTRFGYNWWMDYAPGGDPKGMKKYFVQNMRPNHVYYELGVVNGEKRREFVNTGDAKSLGVTIYFELMKEPKDITLTILDNADNVVRSYNKKDMTLKYADKNSKSFNSGLNKFVWDMRYDAIELINLAPIAAAGEYKVKLVVDGKEQVSSFKLSINPNEKYTLEEQQDKKTFWMKLRKLAMDCSANVQKALKLQEDVNAKAKDANEATKQAAKEVSEIVDTYKATYIPKGRTLAEIINQPAKIFSKMVWIHNMMEQSEGPANKPMKDQYDEIIKVSQKADAAYEKAIKVALEKFEKATK